MRFAIPSTPTDRGALRSKRTLFMNHINPFQATRRIAPALLLLTPLVMLGPHPERLCAQDQAKTTAQAAPSPASEAAIQFLRQLEKTDADAAIGLWDSKAANES